MTLESKGTLVVVMTLNWATLPRALLGSAVSVGRKVMYSGWPWTNEEIRLGSNLTAVLLPWASTYANVILVMNVSAIRGAIWVAKTWSRSACARFERNAFHKALALLPGKKAISGLQ